jgi:hypothetical protein
MKKEEEATLKLGSKVGLKEAEARFTITVLKRAFLLQIRLAPARCNQSHPPRC